MEGESESEDDEMKMKRCRFQKRRLPSSESDSDVDGELGGKPGNKKCRTPVSVKIAESRRSERIKAKKSRVFSMPPRDGDWEKTKNTNYREITPKKLVNDFTRVNHRYNSDNIDLFEDSSMSDFIDDSNDQSEQNTSDSEIQQPHRVKNLLKRKSRNRIIENQTSSDSDEEIIKKDTFKKTQDSADRNTNTVNVSAQQESNTEPCFEKHSANHCDGREDRKSDHGCGNHRSEQEGQCSESKTCGSAESSDSSSDDDDDIKVVRKRQLSTSVLDSDEFSSEDKSASGGRCLRQIRTIEKRNLLFKNLKEARAKHLKPT
ncbi:protein IWS1 homolog A-like [Gigantopelta aegis]|uniref:protein IWS1 homolog A-like n=1 Tax=Gigantopelta aegis TaxID=1735272 RepID=UPI001B889297|nr:protein IWS1 homolog A-like [Gigantopelta aegis]